jgi:hypothetical protein
MLKKRLMEILCVVGLGLVPLLWFKPGLLITGTDLDYPLFPSERFAMRSQLWDNQILGGTDRSNNSASLAYVGGQALLEKTGINLLTNEKITYVIWFLLLGLAGYFFLSVLYPDDSPGSALARLLGTLCYMVNLYQAFLWLRLSINISTLVLIPVFMGLFIALRRKMFRLPLAVLVLSLVSAVCGSTGIQPPLVMILFMLMFFYGLFESIFLARAKNWPGLRQLWKSAFVLSGVFLLSSGYWLLPLAGYVKGAGYESGSVGADVYSVHSLLRWNGQVTSFTNVFRSLADIPWFDGWGGHPYAPEFLIYSESPIFILLSFIFPMIAFSVFVIKKNQERETIYWGLITLIFLFFSKGTHPPFGRVYGWLIDHLPMFWIQRSPWQKFGAVVTLGYSALVGASVRSFYDSLNHRESREEK